MRYIMMLMVLIFSGCVKVPEGIEPVKEFKLDRYLGSWYEIARLDHSFERGLQQISATYSLRDDGGVKVLNRGFNVKANEWSEAEGKAYFVESPDIGYLKVSFFGPFYGSYVIFDLDPNYRYVMIAGPDKSYLWILSRSKTLDKETLDRLIAKAKAAGFDTDKLIFPKQ